MQNGDCLTYWVQPNCWSIHDMKESLKSSFRPQGTLVERIRAGGVGIAAILTDIGIDHELVTKHKSTLSKLMERLI